MQQGATSSEFYFLHTVQLEGNLVKLAGPGSAGGGRKPAWGVQPCTLSSCENRSLRGCLSTRA